MKILKTVSELKQLRKSITDQSVGFIPTMGAIHKGHLSLVAASIKTCDKTFVSIFVNPTQFNNPNDLENYPSQISEDLALLEKAGVDFVFMPEKENLYPDNYNYKVTEKTLSGKFCGQHRPGHFDGVLTVVLKLLNLIKPTQAFFGEKDYQQFTLIQKMAEALFLDVQITPVATVREEDGLALSSRNLRLSNKDRSLAPQFYSALTQSPTVTEAKKQILTWADSVDYIEDYEGRRLAAINIGDVRLIDNVEL